MDYCRQIQEKGYTILPGVFTKETIQKAREEVLSYAKNTNTFLTNSGGKTLPSFLEIPELSTAASLKNTDKIQNFLSLLFEPESFRFCGHSDIGINRIVGWHKDILNGKFAHYQTLDPWANGPLGERYKIVKVAIYLQDHSDDSLALQVVPRSHTRRDLQSTGAVTLHPSIGDVLIFDQRITHRGLEKQVLEPRILISFGFGANNVFTDNFEKGTQARQAEQLGQLTLTH
jgi:hypothetical protein